MNFVFPLAAVAKTARRCSGPSSPTIAACREQAILLIAP